MMNLLQLPSINEDDALVSLADWVELTALFSEKKSASKEDLRIALQRSPQDNDEEPMRRRLSDDAAEAKSADVFSELNDRMQSCSTKEPHRPTYPFVIDEGQSILTMPSAATDGVNQIYLFLLAVTTASMDSRARTLAGLDPTKIFERLCAEVLRTFWGGSSEHSNVMIFGTAKTTLAGQRKFKANIEALCDSLGEGLGWKDTANAPGGGDGALDLVAWRRFQDKREGALVGFAQCKTGDHWRQHLTELDPGSFSRDFMQSKLVLDPLKLYMVPARISRHRWVGATGRAGLLMDRCRIVQYGSNVDTNILRDCKVWFDALCLAQASLMQRLVA